MGIVWASPLLSRKGYQIISKISDADNRSKKLKKGAKNRSVVASRSAGSKEGMSPKRRGKNSGLRFVKNKNSPAKSMLNKKFYTKSKLNVNREVAIPEILNKLGAKIAVEVGVFKAQFSKHLLKNTLYQDRY